MKSVKPADAREAQQTQTRGSFATLPGLPSPSGNSAPTFGSKAIVNREGLLKYYNTTQTRQSPSAAAKEI